MLGAWRMGAAVYWHFRLRTLAGCRMQSRILQVLETQRLSPLVFHAELTESVGDVNFLVEGNADQAYRIGSLLLRLPSVASAVWWAMPRAFGFEQMERVALALFAEEADGARSMDRNDPFWSIAPGVVLRANNFGQPEELHRTEVRLRWTREELCVLFFCRYVDLHLRPGAARLDGPTAELWKHDVAEIFLGDAQRLPGRYEEYEVSPRGEWLDLDITYSSDGVIAGRPIEPGFRCDAVLNRSEGSWTAVMRLPLRRFFPQDPQAGSSLRVNFFRSQGPQPVELAWQPTRQASFHCPSSFGTLLLL